MQEMPFEGMMEDIRDGVKRLAKLIGLAAMAVLLQGCPEKIQTKQCHKTLEGQRMSDAEKVRQECAGGVRKTGGLIDCRDAAGVITLVTSSGD